MKTTLKYIAVIIPLVVAGFYFITTPKEKAYKSIVNQEQILISKGYNSVPVYPVTVSSVGQQYPPSEVKMEIEVSSKEILEADSEKLIGSGGNPFNPRFITEEDVKLSINRILSEHNMALEMFDEDYQGYVINLRHLEMADHISESASKVLEVANEYKTKLIENKD